MSKVVLNGDVMDKLGRLYYTVELCDEAGRVLGRFVPALDISEYEPLTPEISKEELERRKHSKEKRYTTAEVLAHLEKLG
jgi:hypothetical protein